MKTPIGNFARYAVIALLTLLLLEAALQFAFLQLPQSLITRMPQYRQRAGFNLHAEHGAREYPAGQQIDFEITSHSGDLFSLTCLSPADAPPFEPYRVQYTRDKHGFRNDKPWSEAPDLAVIGDSFTAAESVARPFWQGIAESTLSLGLPGSGTLEQQRLFEAFALPLRPATVILTYFGGNDLADSLRYIEMQRSGQTFAQLDHQSKQLWDYSVLFHLVLALRDSVARSQNGDCLYPLFAETNPPTPLAFYADFLPVLAQDRQTLRAGEAFQQTRKSIMEMAQAAQDMGSRFALIYIPQKAELYWQRLSATDKSKLAALASEAGKAVTADQIDTNQTAQRDLIRGLAHELDIGFIDASLPLAQAIKRGEAPYFFADTHWNQLGHDTARIALLDYANQTTLETSS
ncbi:MAG: hypothetical protein OXE46_00140 [Chloroflexi bacterium]|nr:hypothetical protein [Chloroflexota bacterium]